MVQLRAALHYQESRMVHMFYMKERFGAWQVGDDPVQGNIEFKLFFPVGFDPQIQSIRVAGDFQQQISDVPNWDFQQGFTMQKTVRPEGAFWSYRTDTLLKAGFYQYKYLVTFSDGTARIVSDPCTRYGGTDHQNAAFVIGGSRPSDNVVAPLAGGRKPLRDLVIYEMHVDDFTDEFRGVRAPLDAARDRLDYLVDLGINAILFMPWTAWRNRDFDWGYEPFQYFAVEYRYANDLNRPEEKISWLKRLISACHEWGIHVILDGVFNHASTDFPYKFLYKDPNSCPYTGEFAGQFPGLQDLDFDNACTQEFIRDVCLYWIDTFKIDGIRFDNTTNYHRKSDSKGIPQLLEDIQSYPNGAGEVNFSMTLEHLDLSAAEITNNTKATSYWDNALYERCFHYLWHDHIDSRILNALNNDRYLHAADKVTTIYIGNHDHSHVAWQAGARENLGAMKWYKTQPYAIALLTSPGVPMIQQGQEFGETYWVPENDEGMGRRVLPRPLRWKLSHDRIGSTLFRLYKRLIEIRKNYPSLRSRNFYPDFWEEWQTQFNPAGFGVDTAKQVVMYHRWGLDGVGTFQRFIIVLNFSDRPQYVTVPFPENGLWTDLLSGYAGTWKPTISNNRLDVEVGSYWGHIFFR
jgi:1,4-alpha-glucan branching enzyme